ncbi:trypsin-like peptidase domain-containing protein [Catellatospora vulcania]|uniref:trypsin-like peptidase domain-containing protein n=1 Tax=Catellatospora vulcania TaxID=1460450 RepID=UPI0012D3C9E8|nr:trypsin-like peptidase domain-containing protein [Catellatospora vulcania]
MSATLDSRLLRRFVVRLSPVDRRGIPGTGFFIAPGLLLTCAHVVRDADFMDVTADQAVTARRLTAQVVARSGIATTGTLCPYPDLAVLSFDERIDHPWVRLDPADPAGEVDCHSWGFSARERHQLPPGSPASFRFEGVEGDGFLKLKSGQVAPGLSGAPLVCTVRQAVVGVITATRHRETDLGGWAAPVAALIGTSILPELAEIADRIREAGTQGSDAWPKVFSRQRTPGVAATGAAARRDPSSMTLLHLADLRFGDDAVGGDAMREADPYGQDLDLDLTRLIDEQKLRPDLVVVTGDLTERGMPAEFARADRFLRGLTATLGLSRDRLIVVPGDHDVNRIACEGYFKSQQADGVEPLAPFWPKWRHFAAMFRRLYDGVDSAEFTPDRPWTLFEVPGLSVVVAGLNSTMADSHQPEDHYGFCGDEQLAWFAERLRRYRSRGWLRIGAVHHDPLQVAGREEEHLRDVDRLVRILAPELNLLLHGNAHDGQSYHLPTWLPALAAGRRGDAIGTDHADAPSRYHLVSLRGDGFTRYGRCYWPVLRRWEDDLSMTPSGVTWRQDLVHGFADAATTFDAAHTDPVAMPPATAPTWDTDWVNGLMERVHDLVPLRHPNARIAETVHAIADQPPYFRIVQRAGSAAGSWPVGVISSVDDRAVAAFAQVHQRFAADDPHLSSELVYGGREPAGPELIDAARRASIKLLSLTEYQGLIDFRPFVAGQAERLRAETNYPSSLYVPQRFRMLNEHAEAARTGLIETLVGWFDEDQPNFSLLLGDFGHGKSFLLRELTRQLPTRLPHVIPVLIELRHLEKEPTLDQLLVAHLVGANVARIDVDKLHSMVSTGRLALLFDGFDELVVRTNYTQAADYLKTLLQPLDVPNSQAKIVVTSRTQHFGSTEQIRAVLGEQPKVRRGLVRVAVIDSFTDEQILDYLTNLYGGDAAAARARHDALAAVQDLLGLAANPRMLSFLAAMPQERLDQVRRQEGVIGAADLYRELIGWWLGFETGRLRHQRAGLGDEDRFTAVTRLAIQLWTSGASGLALNDLLARVEADLTHLHEQDFTTPQAAHAIGSGTLLVRRDDDTFAFVHQSVLEWLVANAAAIELCDTGQTALLEVRAVSPLMAEFFVDLAGHANARAWASGVLTEPTSYPLAKESALTLTRRLPVDATVDLSARDLRGADLSGLALRGADLSSTVLAGVVLMDIDLSDARLSSADLSDTRLAHVGLAGADLAGAKFDRAQLIDTDLRETRVVGSSWKRAAILGTALDVPALHAPELADAAVAARDDVDVMTSVAFGANCVTVVDSLGVIVVGRGPLVQVRDLASGRPLRNLVGHTGSVTSVTTVEVGGRLLVVSGDDAGDVRRWDLVTGRPVGEVCSHHGGVVWSVTTAVLADGPVIVSGGADGHLWVCDAATGRHMHRMIHAGQGRVVFAVVSAQVDSRPLVVAGAADGTVRAWDLTTGDPVGESWSGFGGPVWSLALVDVGGRAAVAAAGRGGLVRVFDLRSGQPIGPAWHTQDGPAWSLAAATVAGSPVVAVACGSGAVRTMNPVTGQPADSVWLDRPGSQLSLASAELDGRRVIVVCDDDGGQVRVLDLEHLDVVGEPWTEQVDSHRMLEVAGLKGRVVIVATEGREGTVWAWDAVTGSPVGERSRAGFGSAVSMAIGDLDGRPVVVSGGSDGYIRTADLDTGAAVGRPWPAHVGAVRMMATARLQGQPVIIVGGVGPASLSVCDLATGRLLTTLTGPAASLDSLTVKTIGEQTIVVAAGDGVLSWDLDSGDLMLADLWTRDGVTGRSAVVGVNGEPFVLWEADGVLRVLDLSDQRLAGRPLRHPGSVRCVAVSSLAGGAVIVAGGQDGLLRLSELATGEPIGEPFQAHTGPIWSVRVVDVDGSPVVVTGGGDGTIRVWDLAHDRCRLTIVPFEDGESATLHADGSYRLTGDAGGRFWWAMKLCRFEPGELDPYVATVSRRH